MGSNNFRVGSAHPWRRLYDQLNNCLQDFDDFIVIDTINRAKILIAICD
jgi:hypothetical protein